MCLGFKYFHSIVSANFAQLSMSIELKDQNVRLILVFVKKNNLRKLF